VLLPLLVWWVALLFEVSLVAFTGSFCTTVLGRRRGWLVLTQGALILAIAAMGLQRPSQALQLWQSMPRLLRFSASQDILVDAYRTDVLEEREIGPGAAIYLWAIELPSSSRVI
jgi:PAT family beta-lactamase induction signal transducer AmpG